MSTENREAEAEIRALIERWAAAVQAQDLEGVLADHTADVQMFDVPPPNEVRGMDAYRETWPAFFKWLSQGGVFELETLDVTAGEEIAFATALLRCGTDEGFRKDLDSRLRLTVGLRRQNGRWLIAHEHHSFPAP
jgi:uncharacterized protein (TIGR02246 family)